MLHELFTPALNLQNTMEPIINKKISEYMVGATGPNRTGLFALVAPTKENSKFRAGSLFSKTRFAR